MKKSPVRPVARAPRELPFEFLNAKLRGRRRTVYEGDRLARLSECRTLEALADRLFRSETIVGRLAIERRLRQDCVKELAFVVPYLPESFAQFYIALLRRFQIDNILVLLRLFSGRPRETSPESYVPEMPRLLSLPSGELLSSADLTEFIHKLPEDLSEAVSPVVARYKDKDSAVFVEMALERAYWEGVCAGFKWLPADYRETCIRPILYELYAARLMAVLRAARNYKVRWEDLQPLLPPAAMGSVKSGLGASDSALRRVHEQPAPERIAASVRALRKPKVPESLLELEELFWQEIFRRANRVYYTAPEGPAVLVGYYYVRRNELKNLTALVESIHYSKRMETAK